MNSLIHPLILLVEDDENDIWFIQHAWKRNGIANPLRVVHDGQEAINYLSGEGPFADRARHPLPALVLLDLNLPRRKGLEVLRWLREQPCFDSVIVIILTSSAADTDIETAYHLGANSYLLKPTGPEDLIALIKAFKLYWLECNQIPPPGVSSCYGNVRSEI